MATAELGPLDEFQRARADLLRGQIAFASRRGSDAPPLLLKAAKSLEMLDVRLARETYLEALFAALFAGRLALGGGAREVAEAARAAPPPPPPARAPDLLRPGQQQKRRTAANAVASIPARRQPPRADSRRPRSAGDVELVHDIHDAAGHPGGGGDRVVFGPSADVAGERDRVPAGVHHHVAVIKDQRVAVQCVLDEERDVDRVRGVGDLDVGEAEPCGR